MTEWKPEDSKEFADKEKVELDKVKADLAAKSQSPSNEAIMQFFQYDHLPEGPKEISKACSDLAHQLLLALPRNAERSVALRKLLEAKDAAVRSFIAK